MKFKIGDKVKVREDLKDGARWNVAPEMLAYKGMVATVIRYVGMISYRLDIDSEKWSWSDEMLEEISDLKPVDQVIEELEDERTGIIENNKKIGQMINRNVLTIEQNELLAAQKRAYDTVSMILGVRIRSLKKQLPEPEPVKFNVQVPGLDGRFYWKTATGQLETAGVSGNDDENQLFTWNEIKQFKLQDCPRFEVTE